MQQNSDSLCAISIVKTPETAKFFLAKNICEKEHRTILKETKKTKLYKYSYLQCEKQIIGVLCMP
jgi:hypothetical protein